MREMNSSAHGSSGASVCRVYHTQAGARNRAMDRKVLCQYRDVVAPLACIAYFLVGLKD